MDCRVLPRQNVHEDHPHIKHERAFLSDTAYCLAVTRLHGGGTRSKPWRRHVMRVRTFSSPGRDRIGDAARRADRSFAALGRARVFHLPGADADDSAGDRNYLVLARPNVIMSDTRLRGLAVAGTDTGRKSLHNHAQIARNLRRSLETRRQAFGQSESKGWTANRLLTSRRPLRMRSRSFAGLSGASVGVFDATTYAWTHAPLSSLDSARRCRAR
jgi:hypothetical protein